MNNEHFAVRIWENYFELLMKIKSKSERNALCFALVYYGFHQTLPQDVKLKESTLLLFEAIKHNIVAKNQGGRKKRFDNGLETDNKALSNNKADKQIADKQIINKKNTKKVFSEEFEEFWQEYPKQRAGSKEKAYTAYCRVLKERRATSELMLASAQKYATSQEVQKGFAKGCAAWLNDDRFNVDYSVSNNNVAPKEVSFWDTPEGKEWMKNAEELDRLDEERKKNETNGS